MRLFEANALDSLFIQGVWQSGNETKLPSNSISFYFFEREYLQKSEYLVLHPSSISHSLKALSFITLNDNEIDVILK